VVSTVVAFADTTTRSTEQITDLPIQPIIPVNHILLEHSILLERSLLLAVIPNRVVHVPHLEAIHLASTHHLEVILHPAADRVLPDTRRPVVDRILLLVGGPILLLVWEPIPLPVVDRILLPVVVHIPFPVVVRILLAVHIPIHRSSLQTCIDASRCQKTLAYIICYRSVEHRM